MRYLVLILVLLLPSTASAGQAAKRMMMVMNVCNPATSINCVSAISSSGVTDTGTYTYPSTLTSATVQAAASCNGNSGTSNVYLAVDGITQDSIQCGSGVNLSRTLTYTGSISSVRIYGTKGTNQTGTFSASGFVIPR